MAHYAKIVNGIVTQVVVIANKDTADAQGAEKEHIGAAYCERLFGGEWKQTSYHGKIRKNYAGIGYSYDPALDAFVPPRPGADWTLDPITAQWVAPPDSPTAGTGTGTGTGA